MKPEAVTTILLTSILIVAVFAIITVYVLTMMDNFRLELAKADWSSEALTMVSRLISSKDCFAYEKKIIFFDKNTTEVYAYQRTFPNVIDLRKFSLERAQNCLRLFDEHHFIYMDIKLITESGKIYEIQNDISLLNENTIKEISLPVKIMKDDYNFEMGKITVLLSVDAKYFGRRVL